MSEGNYKDSVVLDDPVLSQDYLVRSLHRNPDGHLGTSTKGHADVVKAAHNVAVLFVYMAQGDGFILEQRYVYSHVSRPYVAWRRLVFAEVHRLNTLSEPCYYGVYGWITSILKISVLRNGDLFINIDKHGIRSVRLTFNSGKNSNASRTKAKQKAPPRNRHRFR